MSAHWNTIDDRSFVLKDDVILRETLPPDVYKITNQRYDYIFSRVEDNSDDLLRFSSSSVIKEAVDEIENFWTKRKFFRDHGFPFCRGILLYGSPGSGKSCSAKMIIKDVVNRGGICIVVNDIFTFSAGMKIFRTQQPETPVVALIENIERMCGDYEYESELLQMLDGIGGFDGVCYIGITNFIQNIPDRIKNRPSRFDRKYLIDYPDEPSRLEYLKFITEKGKLTEYPIEEWAKDSEGLSYAHLKELFISVVCFNIDYKDALDRLRNMSLDEEEDDDDNDDDDDDDDECENCCPEPCEPGN